MDQTFALPVATHVARREAGLAVERGRVALGAFEAMNARISEVAWARFSQRRKLEGGALAALALEVRGYVESNAPLDSRVTFVPPTRGRPKGESYEFLAAQAFGAHDGTGDVRALASMRVSLSRRRAVIDHDFLGVSVTRHALERAIERDVVAWTGGLREVDEALYGHLGLVVAWRWAMISKRVPREVDSHLPFGQGLILGRFRIYGPDGCCSRWVSDAHGTGDVASPPKDLHVAVSDGKPRAFFEFVGGTILHDDNLRLDQADYRDAMNALVERHSGALARLRKAATWRVAGNQPTPGFDDLRAELDAVADDIAAIVAHPRLGAVVAPRAQEAPADASAWVQPR